MAATVADYVVVADSQVALHIGGDVDQTWNFSLPSNITTNNAVVRFMLEADNNPNSLNWKMDINGTEVYSATHGLDRFCAVQEVFAGSILHSGTNSLTVKVLSGSGTLKISDVVVDFQASV